MYANAIKHLDRSKIELVHTLESQISLIQKQDRKIKNLREELDQVKRERDELRTKVSLLSHKLHLLQPFPMTVPTVHVSEVQNAGEGAPQPPARVESVKSNMSTSSNAILTCPRRRVMERHVHEDSEKLKWSRGWANAYELSEDMREKQLQMLERKYGGHIRARRAARIIQQAFRQYCMTRNFEKMRADKGLSRRSQACWSDLNIPEASLSLLQRNSLYLPGNLTATSPSAMHKSRSFNVTVSHEQLTVHPSANFNGAPHIKRKSCTITATTLSPTSAAERNNNRNSCLEMNHSPPAIDVPSVNFENLLETKEEAEMLDESFHSDGSQDASQSYEHYQYAGDETMSRIYHNPEVKLRNKKRNGSGTEGADTSPVWKRKSSYSNGGMEDPKRMSNISENSESGSHDGRESRVSSSAGSDSTSISNENIATYKVLPGSPPFGPATSSSASLSKLSDRQRKRLYRIGLNLFNKRPDKGVQYLIEHRFIENRPSCVARFFLTRKGLSKQMIGEFLGNLQKQFNMETLSYFANETDLGDLEIDESLRRYQSLFRMPGEAQKIERLMEAFANQHCICNPDLVKRLRSPDTVFLLAFAIIMLNTDLHNSNIKKERKMKLDDFMKNLRGIDAGEDVDPEMLTGIYLRIAERELKPAADHVSQVLKVEQMITGKKPQLALPHRRLVCYCRLYEVTDPNKKEKLGLHQREIFLFNDLLMVTKIFSKKKNNVMYTFRSSLSLCGMMVNLFEKPGYPFGIRLTSNIDGKVLMYFNARNEHDRTKFMEDLREAILEMNEMESLRIEEELQRQSTSQPRNFNRHSKDSGVVDIELIKPGDMNFNRLSAPECTDRLKKNTLSNSLIDLSPESCNIRRGSGSSLDSGLVSIPQTNGGSSPKSLKSCSSSSSKSLKSASNSTSLFSSMFSKKSKNNSRGSVKSPELSEV